MHAMNLTINDEQSNLQKWKILHLIPKHDRRSIIFKSDWSNKFQNKIVPYCFTLAMIQLNIKKTFWWAARRKPRKSIAKTNYDFIKAWIVIKSFPVSRWTVHDVFLHLVVVWRAREFLECATSLEMMKKRVNKM